MKKFTIIAAPEYEHEIIRELGRARIVQLKQVSGGDFDRLRTIEVRDADFEGLYKKFHLKYNDLKEKGILDLESKEIANIKLREFTEDPDQVVEDFLNLMDDIQKKSEEISILFATEQPSLWKRICYLREWNPCSEISQSHLIGELLDIPACSLKTSREICRAAAVKIMEKQ